MENFTRKIDDLTPSLNHKKNKFFTAAKIRNPLKETKEVFMRKDKFNEKELKEYYLKLKSHKFDARF